MCRFLGDLDLRMHPNGRLWKLLKPFTYLTSINPLDFGYTVDLPTMSVAWLPEKTSTVWSIDIPHGFVTDFASVPWWLWSVVPPIGRHSLGSVVHDWLYTTHREGRPWADRVFKEAMEANGTNGFVREACYWGVRTGGRKSWDDADKGWDDRYR